MNFALRHPYPVRHKYGNFAQLRLNRYAYKTVRIRESRMAIRISSDDAIAMYYVSLYIIIGDYIIFGRIKYVQCFNIRLGITFIVPFSPFTKNL